MYDYISTKDIQTDVSKWISSNEYKFFISIQLPAHLKSSSLEKSSKSLKKIFKSLEKDLLGRRWHKHHIPFIIFAEKGTSAEEFHFHILMRDNNGVTWFDFFTFSWVLRRTMDKFKLNEYNIHCEEITKTPEKLYSYVVKELVADNKKRINSERIIPSPALFNL